MRSRLAVLHDRLGPLAPAAALAGFLMVLFSLGRLGMLVAFWQRLRLLDGLGTIFLRGLCIDGITIALACCPLALYCLLLGKEHLSRYWHPGALWGAMVMAAACFTEIVTPTFAPQFESRPGRILLEYLAYPREIFSAIYEQFFLGALLSFASIAVGGWLAWRTARRLFQTIEPWPTRRRARASALCLLVFAGALASFGASWPKLLALAAVNEDHLARSMTRNSLVSVGCAELQMLGDELEARHLYGDMDRKELIRRIRRDSAVGDEAYPDASLPLLRTINRGRKALPRRKNVILIVCEGLGAAHSKAMGGRDLAPCFDAFADSGMAFQRCHATGDRTVKGLDALVAGFPPAPGRSPIKMSRPFSYPFFTVARLLKSKGYRTAFHYGGRASFDEMGPFYRSNGFDEIHDLDGMTKVTYEAAWGACDEDLFSRTTELLSERGDAAFFSLILTTTNHLPFLHPEGRFPDVESPHHTVANSLHYADACLGAFLDRCRKESWWKNTLVLVSGDHNTWTRGPGPMPLGEFHVAAALAGPGVARCKVNRLCSQIDLLPTLLYHLDEELLYPGLGRNMATLPPQVPGRAFSQLGFLSGYRIGDRAVIYGPAESPRCYDVVSGKLLPRAPAPETIADGRALFLAAGFLHRTSMFRLP